MTANCDCTVYRFLPEGGCIRVLLRGVNWQQEEGVLFREGQRPSGYLQHRTRVFLPLSVCPAGWRPRAGDLLLRGECPIAAGEARREALLRWEAGCIAAAVLRLQDNGGREMRHWEVAG